MPGIRTCHKIPAKPRSSELSQLCVRCVIDGKSLEHFSSPVQVAMPNERKTSMTKICFRTVERFRCGFLILCAGLKGSRVVALSCENSPTRLYFGSASPYVPRTSAERVACAALSDCKVHALQNAPCAAVTTTRVCGGLGAVSNGHEFS